MSCIKPEVTILQAIPSHTVYTCQVTGELLLNKWFSEFFCISANLVVFVQELCFLSGLCILSEVVLSLEEIVYISGDVRWPGRGEGEGRGGGDQTPRNNEDCSTLLSSDPLKLSGIRLRFLLFVMSFPLFCLIVLLFCLFCLSCGTPLSFRSRSATDVRFPRPVT